MNRYKFALENSKSVSLRRVFIEKMNYELSEMRKQKAVINHAMEAYVQRSFNAKEKTFKK